MSSRRSASAASGSGIAISRGISATRAITEFEPQGPCRVAAAVPEDAIRDDGRGDTTEDASGNGRADPRRYAKASRIAVLAAREAWRDAGLRPGQVDAGVIIGSGGGGIDVGERQYQRFLHRAGGKQVTPYAIPVSIVGMVSSEISISLRLRGISHVLSCGCTSSTDAIGYAASLIRAGEADVAAVGRRRRLRDARDDLRLLAHARRVDALQRPAGGTPRGRSIAGATASCSAKARGCSCSSARIARGRAARRIYASIDGYGSTCDAYHRVQMDPDGGEIVRAIATGDRARRAGRPRRSATSTITARRRS